MVFGYTWICFSFVGLRLRVKTGTCGTRHYNTYCSTRIQSQDPNCRLKHCLQCYVKLPSSPLPHTLNTITIVLWQLNRFYNCINPAEKPFLTNMFLKKLALLEAVGALTFSERAQSRMEINYLRAVQEQMHTWHVKCKCENSKSP